MLRTEEWCCLDISHSESTAAFDIWPTTHSCDRPVLNPGVLSLPWRGQRGEREEKALEPWEREREQHLASHLNGLIPIGQTRPSEGSPGAAVPPRHSPHATRAPRRAAPHLPSAAPQAPPASRRGTAARPLEPLEPAAPSRGQPRTCSCARRAVPQCTHCQQVWALLPPGLDVPIFAGPGVNPAEFTVMLQWRL